MADDAMPLRRPSEASGAELLEHDGIEFDAIEAAVLETSRGRWFLREYARRVRAQDHDRIESTLARIETRLSDCGIADRGAMTHAPMNVPQQLVDLAKALRARGVSEQDCVRIETQARALMDAASRRAIVGAVEELEKGFRDSRKMPAA
ncbi:MAG: hypothetical protein Q8M31_12360 [Beijerinckiaceae bacterium]|nr:hypothetical protein [Beijerinckiaceae bacterium]